MDVVDAYLIDMTTGERLQLQFIPDEISVDRVPDVQGIKIVGKNTNDYQFTGGETMIKFTLTFYTVEENRKDVLRKLRWIESLTYTNGKQGVGQVKFLFGQLYQDELWAIKTLPYKMGIFDKSKGMLPLYGTIDITLGRESKKNLTRRDILK